MPHSSWGSAVLVPRVALVLAATTAVSACAAVVTADDERLRLASPEFRAYVEQVFREQNELADALAFATEDQPSPPVALAEAEQVLQSACTGVNELATARRDSRPLGMRHSLELARSVPGCERATRQVRGVLAPTPR
jgi:hypothetical protein